MAGNLTAMIASIFSGAVSTDPYFNYTTLLLSTTATNGQQNNTFQDSSTNNFTITRNPATGPNAPTQGTFSPFSPTWWSNYFDGTGDYLQTASNAAFDLGTGNFTLEFWVNPTGVSQAFITRQSSASGWGNIQWYLNTDASGNLVLAVSNGVNGTNVFANPNIPRNAWSHVAIVRNTNIWYVYLNGVSQSLANGTAYSSSMETNATGQPLNIGGFPGWALTTGNIADVRLVKGIPVYTGNFTPPTKPLSTSGAASASAYSSTTNVNTTFAASATSLLTCQSNRFVDNSNNNFTITRNGDTSVVPFSPFNPTSAWSASTVGGSGYFDGTGDYLTANDNTALELGSSNFCLEFMYYPTSSANTDFVTKRVNASSYGVIIAQTGLALNFWLSSNGSSWDLFSNAALGSVTLNAWNHLAIYRIGNAWYSSLNGTITTLSASLSGSVVNNAANWNIGGNNYASGSVIGYLSNFRLVIGSSVYTSTSAPIPTAPLTAITNTSLLLNFTNSGIYDATAKNVLETVGTAQASTTQAKFGTTSMYFDGVTTPADYLIPPLSPYSRIGSGDYTLEMWLRPGNVTTLQALLSYGSTAFRIFLNSSNIWFLNSGTTIVQYNSVVTTANQWYYLVLVRKGSSGTNCAIFLNGTRLSTGFANTTDFNTGTPNIGGEGASNLYQGYMQDFRLTRFARYDPANSTITVPTAAFPVQ